jgi:hypothetical protein
MSDMARKGASVFPMKRTTTRIAQDRIRSSIILIRGQKVILDQDLAALYGVETRNVVQAVKRNLARFPADFMFRLSEREFERLRSQTVISNTRGGRRSAPYAFTEQGVAMLSSVLHSRRAVRVNIEIMRAFVHLRRLITEHRELMERIDEMEKRYDENFQVVFHAIRALINPAMKPSKRIGYLAAPASAA